MMNNLPFGMPPFDPSKMNPKVLMQLSQLVQELPREQLSQMQSLMHNTMAGLDVRREMEEFEKTLPPGFKEKVTALVASQAAEAAIETAVVTESTTRVSKSSSSSLNTSPSLDSPMDLSGARLTILGAVAAGKLSPEEAERLLFPESA